MPKRIPRIIVELRGLAHAQSKRPKEPKSLIEYVEVMKVALLHFKIEGWGKLFSLSIFWPLFTLITACCAIHLATQSATQQLQLYFPLAT